MTADEPTWIATLPAAKAVRDHGIDDADRRELLEMCGLVPRGLPVIRFADVLPDDTRNYDVEGNAPDSGSTIGWRRVVPEPPADPANVPVGLREGAA